MTEKYVVGRLFDQPDLNLFDNLEHAVAVRDQNNQNRLPRSLKNQVYRITLVDAPETIPEPTDKELATRFLVRVGAILPDGSPSPNYYSEQEIQEYHLKRKGKHDNY